jgi:hypothetical protein
MNFESKEKIIEKYDAVQLNECFRIPEFVTEFSENTGSGELLEQPGFRSQRMAAK